MTQKLDQLMQSAIEAVKDAAEDRGCHPRDIDTSEIFELVIPAENHQLVDLLSDDLTLGYPEEMPFFAEGPDVFQVIYHAICERLGEAIFEWMKDLEGR